MNVIQTERLALRRLELPDAEFILELLNEVAFLRFIGDKGVRSVADARAYILKGPMDSYWRCWLRFVRDLSARRHAGWDLRVIKRDGLADVDVGFAFRSRHCSMGYAVESASAVLDHARQVLGLQRIVAITAPENLGSTAVLEKIGLVRTPDQPR